MILVKEKLLECVSCQAKFSVLDVKNSLFFVSTLTCSLCYNSAVRSQDKQAWCFGDFDAKHRNCRTDCPDKKICWLFTLKQIEKTFKKGDEYGSQIP
jgi:hypothetical protein